MRRGKTFTDDDASSKAPSGNATHDGTTNVAGGISGESDWQKLLRLAETPSTNNDADAVARTIASFKVPSSVMVRISNLKKSGDAAPQAAPGPFDQSLDKIVFNNSSAPTAATFANTPPPTSHAGDQSRDGQPNTGRLNMMEALHQFRKQNNIPLFFARTNSNHSRGSAGSTRHNDDDDNGNNDANNSESSDDNNDNTDDLFEGAKKGFIAFGGRADGGGSDSDKSSSSGPPSVYSVESSDNFNVLRRMGDDTAPTILDDPISKRDRKKKRRKNKGKGDAESGEAEEEQPAESRAQREAKKRRRVEKIKSEQRHYERHLREFDGDYLDREEEKLRANEQSSGDDDGEERGSSALWTGSSRSSSSSSNISQSGRRGVVIVGEEDDDDDDDGEDEVEAKHSDGKRETPADGGGRLRAAIQKDYAGDDDDDDADTDSDQEIGFGAKRKREKEERTWKAAEEEANKKRIDIADEKHNIFRYGDNFFECYLPETSGDTGSFVHHTLAFINSPLTVQGNIAIVSVKEGSEILLNGYLLGKREVILLDGRTVRSTFVRQRLGQSDDDYASAADSFHLYNNMCLHGPVVLTPLFSNNQSTPSRNSYYVGKDPSSAEREEEGRLYKSVFDSVFNSSDSHEQILFGSSNSRDAEGGTGGASSNTAASAAAIEENEESENNDDDDDEKIEQNNLPSELFYGSIDWDWVEATLGKWRHLHATENFFNPNKSRSKVAFEDTRKKKNKKPMNVVLIIQPVEEPVQHNRDAAQFITVGMKRYRVRDTKRGNDGAGTRDWFIEIPKFICYRESNIQIPKGLLASVLPSLLSSSSYNTSSSPNRKGTDAGVGSVSDCRNVVAVVGDRDTGKTTLTKYLVNAFFSQMDTERCTNSGNNVYYLESDLGQPLFGPPQSYSLVKINNPFLIPFLFENSDIDVNNYTNMNNESREQGANTGSNKAFEILFSVFVGCLSPTDPLPVSNAIDAICRFCSQLLDSPTGAASEGDGSHAVPNKNIIVLNTHGWILRTGRRSTVEFIRRLRPKCIINLTKPLARQAYGVSDGAAKENEDTNAEAREWARDIHNITEYKNGMNSRVVQQRFLVRDYDHHNDNDNSANLGFLALPDSKAASKTGELFHCDIHTIEVENYEANADSDSTHHKSAHFKKGASSRRNKWVNYFYPLIQHYRNAREDGINHRYNNILLDLPFADRLAEVISADWDEKVNNAVMDTSIQQVVATTNNRSVPFIEVAASLEHTVVAMQFLLDDAGGRNGEERAGKRRRLDRSSTSDKDESTQDYSGTGNVTGVRLNALANKRSGFVCHCYGLVESSERELLQKKTLRVRIPHLAPGLIRQLRSDKSSSSINSNTALPLAAGVKVKICLSSALRRDTNFMHELLEN